jgi:hypothetical protein
VGRRLVRADLLHPQDIDAVFLGTQPGAIVRIVPNMAIIASRAVHSNARRFCDILAVADFASC